MFPLSSDSIYALLSSFQQNLDCQGVGGRNNRLWAITCLISNEALSEIKWVDSMIVDTIRISIFPNSIVTNRRISYVSLDISNNSNEFTRKWNDNQNTFVCFSPAQSKNTLHSCCTRDSQANICMCLCMRTFDFVRQRFTASFDIYTATRMRGLYFDFVAISFTKSMVILH